jgi:hypothetical protein
LVGEWVPLPSSKTSYLEWPCLCVRSVRPLPNASALIGPRAERLAASRRCMFSFTSADHCCLVGRESASSGQLDRGIPSVRSRIVNEQRFITFLPVFPRTRPSPSSPYERVCPRSGALRTAASYLLPSLGPGARANRIPGGEWLRMLYGLPSGHAAIRTWSISGPFNQGSY